jgi:hypothetical protein
MTTKAGVASHQLLAYSEAADRIPINGTSSEMYELRE